jgi:hypothetical protein
LPLRAPPALALDAPPALPFLALALDAPPVLAFVVVPVVLVFVVPPVVLVLPPVVEVLVVVVVVVLVEFALFALSVAHPVQKAATPSSVKRAKVLRIEFSPVTHRVEC